MARAMAGVANKMSIKKRKYKPVVNIGVNVETSEMTPGEPRHNWRKDEMDRTAVEIGALEKELGGFSAKEAAAKVKRSLELKLKLKKIRLEELKLKMDSSGIEY